MLIRKFKFERNKDRGGFQWTAESKIEHPGFHRGFTAVGKTLSDVKEFATLVRWCERTGSLERLSEMHPPDFESRMQTTWGGNWYPQKRTVKAVPSTRTGKERSTSDLAQIDERNVGLCRVKSDGTVERIEAEDIQADFIRAESTLGPNVPSKIRKRIVVARSLVAYGWFSYEFYAVAVFWSLSCLEMALRLKFSETHPGPLKLTKKKASEAVAFHEVEGRLNHGWRIEGMPTFNFSLRSLLDWAREADFLPPETNINWILALRNSMAHPTHFNWVLPPGDSLEVFRLLIGIVVKSWPE